MRFLLTTLFCVMTYGAFAQATDSLPPYNNDEIIDTGTVEQGKVIKVRKKLTSPTGLFVGGNFGLSFSRTIAASFAPYVGYRIGKFLAVGAGIPYTFYYNIPNKIVGHVYGGRAFLRLRPFGMLRGFVSTMYLHAEGEYLQAAFPAYPSANRSAPAVNVGLGFMSRFDKGWSFTTEILVNLLYKHPNAITQFFQYRIGFCYNF